MSRTLKADFCAQDKSPDLAVNFAFTLNQKQGFLTVQDYEILAQHLAILWPLYRRGEGRSFAIRFSRETLGKHYETACQTLQNYAASLMEYVELFSSFNGLIVYDRPRRWSITDRSISLTHSAPVQEAIERGRKTQLIRKSLIRNWRKGKMFPSYFRRADWRIIELIAKML